MHSSIKARIAHLKVNEALTKVSSKYTDFANVFSPKLAAELPKHTKINNHAIKLADDWQLLYGLIYSLGFVELETLKAYIENNLANGFIRSSKSPAEVSIFFDNRSDGSLRLYLNYQGFNNLTIKN